MSHLHLPANRISCTEILNASFNMNHVMTESALDILSLDILLHMLLITITFFMRPCGALLNIVLKVVFTNIFTNCLYIIFRYSY